MLDVDRHLDAYTKRIQVESNRKAEFVEGLQVCDKAISDILHHMELSRLSIPLLIEDAKLLVSYLRKRRKYKDRLELIKTSELCDVAALKRKVSIQNHREYRPRVLQDLNFLPRAKHKSNT